VIDIALPLLEAGKSLRFALMPEGKDPDDLIRASGAGAMQTLLDQALPMVHLLWRRETEGQVFDSPERRAALDRSLRERIKTIADPSIRSHYGQAIKEMRWQLFNPRRPGGSGPKGRKWQPPGTPQASTKSSVLAGAGDHVQEHIREAVILATLVVTPELIEEVETQLERMECRDPDHAAIRTVLLGLPPGEDAQQAVAAHLGGEALENLMHSPHVAICPAVRHPGDAEQARLTLSEVFGKLIALRGLDAEVAEAAEEMTGVANEALTWRLREAAEACNRALRSQQEDRAAYDQGDNGMMIDRDERSAFDALLSKITYSKPGR